MTLRNSWAVAALLVALAASTCASLVRPIPGVGRYRTKETDTTGTTVVERLPLEAMPTEYDITITPYFVPEGDFLGNEFEGTVAIKATIAKEGGTDTITLHAAGLTFGTGNVTVAYYEPESTETITPEVTSNAEQETVAIKLNKTLTGEITISISYTGKLAEDMDGFYVSTYEVSGQKRYLAATQFETSSARKAFPCFDEPAVKAKFKMTIYPPEGYSALFNTDPVEDDITTTAAPDNGDGNGNAARRSSPALLADRTPVKFGQTEPMSTYLVAFVVYDEETFGALEGKSSEGNNPIRIWSRDDFANQRAYAVEVAAASLEAYGRLFLDYFVHMNPKMDQVAIPDFSAGAMENWGLVTYRERAVLIDEAESTTSSRSSVVTTIAHELAHQWFGDLVSPDFWNVLWLNEGFATYWSYHADLGSIIEGWRLSDQFLAEEMTAALETDSKPDTHPMTTASNTLAPFDDITYSKGGCILRMFSQWLGEDIFYERLNNYLLAHNYSSALPDYLFEALSAGDETLRSNLAFWTTTAGYPVINVTRDGSNVTLQQDKYQLTSSGDDEVDPVWPILVFYYNDSKFSEDSVDSVWMTEEKLDITIDLSDEDPLILNHKWSGFYRVNYDAVGWQAVQEALTSGQLLVPSESRAQLLSDAFSLARSDHQQYKVALDLSRYLSKEVDYLPWAVAFKAFDFLETALAPTDHYSAFKTYMQSLLEQPYTTLGFSVLPEDDHATRLLRMNVLKHTCRYGHSQCQEAAQALSADALPAEGGQQIAASVEPDLRSTAYCVWAQDNALWGKLWQHYLETTVATEKVELLTALGCSQDTNTLYQYLTNSLNASMVRPQDWSTVYAGVYSTPLGLNLAIDFIDKNAEALAKQTSMLKKILSGLAGKVVTDEQLNQLKILSDVPFLEAVNATLQSAIASAEMQVDWAKEHVADIGDWLVSHLPVVAGAVSLMTPSTLHLLLGAAAGIVLALLN